jgi:glycosyltransferase involved in cell wall biosynthesis
MQAPASGERELAHIHLVYAGPLDEQHRVVELAQAFLAARDHDARLHLLIVGEGSERTRLERLLGHTATFFTPQEAATLGEFAGGADLLISPTTGPDTAETIIAAQRAGVAVLAVDGGEARSLIENGRSGFLVPDDPVALTDAIRWLSRRAPLRERLATGGRLARGEQLPSGRERIMSA